MPAGSAVRASSWARSKVTSAAVAFALTSSAVSSPTIAEATAGRASSQASDTWYGCKPDSWLSRSTARPISSSVSVNPEPPNLLSPERLCQCSSPMKGAEVEGDDCASRTGS